MRTEYDIALSNCVDLEEELEEAIFHGDTDLMKVISEKQIIARTKLGLAECGKNTRTPLQ